MPLRTRMPALGLWRRTRPRRLAERAFRTRPTRQPARRISLRARARDRPTTLGTRQSSRVVPAGKSAVGGRRRRRRRRRPTADGEGPSHEAECGSQTKRYEPSVSVTFQILSDNCELRRSLVDSRPREMEVVERGPIAHKDRVGARGQVVYGRAVAGERDVTPVTRAHCRDKAGRRRRRRRRRGGGGGGGGGGADQR